MKIFRKLRQKMLSGKKIGKYLLYSVGEIALVVIGILIAVQIDNKSKESELHELEMTVLSEISTNLSMDTVDVSYNINALERTIPMVESIISELATDSITDTTASILYYIDTYRLSLSLFNSGYKNAANIGLNRLIQNDSLRKEISILYEFNQTYLLDLENGRVDNRNFEKRMSNTVTKHLKIVSSANERGVSIKNIEALLNDNQLLVNLNIGLENLMYTLEAHKSYLSRSKELNKKIIEYIDTNS